MSPAERNAIDKLELRLFGDDGTGGAIGAIQADVRQLRSGWDRAMGALKLAAYALAFLGFSGGVFILNALVGGASAHP